MRLITRNDTSLVVGLIAGTVVIFQQPLRFVWEAAWAVQERYHVDLLPALTIFAGVFIFHEARKRQRTKAEAVIAAAEAAQARLRSAELERLMAFSQALANALDPTTLQQAWWRHLPSFTGEREFWVLARRLDRWEMFVHDTTTPGRRELEDREAIADRALSPDTLHDARLSGIVAGDALCFPMVAGGVPVGVLGIRDGATITGDERKALGVAIGLIAIAVRNVQLLMETREHGLRDSLTNCFNRGHGLEALDREMRLARRSQQPLSILMFDVDHFKTINDELGHLRGDDLLRAVGAQLTRVVRSTDIRCRYGGDEFLIILPDTPMSGAQRVAESVRQAMVTLTMVAGGKTIPVTVSVGIATAGPDELGVTGVIERADAALYHAKRLGRDRWSAEPDPGAGVSATSDRSVTTKPASTVDPVDGDPHRHAQVLVVEDEPGVREFIRLALVRAGREVLAVAGPRAALAALNTRPAILLMLVDVVMPEMDGYDLAAEARKIAPGLHVVFMSAFAVDAERLPHGDGFLSKPFTVDSLTGIVGAALAH